MKYASPGKFRTAEEFRQRWREVAPGMDCDTELLGAAGPLGKPLELGTKMLSNRFVTHPMEGWDGEEDGLPSPLTLRRWRNFGRSGAKLIWGGEAYAVQEDGKANARQLFLNPNADAERGLTRLRQELREGHDEIGEDPDELYIGLQLTHSGRFARPFGPELQPRIVCRHPALDAKFGIDPGFEPLSDGELEAIGENYVRAAVLAASAGYDFVDLKCCHGYLMHELLGARWREGSYGGSFENRTRLVRRILEGIRSASPKLEVGVRVSVGDLFPYAPNEETQVGEPAGWDAELPYEHGFGLRRDDPREMDLQEPLRFLGLLEELGIRLVNVTLGSPYYCPHLSRPAAYPPSDGYLPPEDPLRSVARHIQAARRCKEAYPGLILVGTGYTYLQEYAAYVAQYEIGRGHVDCVGFGRMMLSYPELPLDVLRGRELDRRRICRTFSECTTAPRSGIVSGCYPLDEFYQALPEGDRMKELRKTRIKRPGR